MLVEKHSLEGIYIRPDFKGESKIEGIDKNLYSFNNVTFKNSNGQDLELGEYHIAAKSMRVALLALETLARQSQQMSPEQFASFKNTHAFQVLSFRAKITDHHKFPKPWKAREGFVTVYRQHDTFSDNTYLFGKNTTFPSNAQTLKYDHPYITRIERLAELLKPRQLDKPPLKAQLNLEEVDSEGVVIHAHEEDGVKIRFKPQQEVIRFDDKVELGLDQILAAEREGYGKALKRHLS